VDCCCCFTLAQIKIPASENQVIWVYPIYQLTSWIFPTKSVPKQTLEDCTMPLLPIQIEGATPLTNGASAYLPPVGGGSVPFTEQQRKDTLAYLLRRIADAGRRADRARTGAHFEDAQRDITKFARQLAEIAARPVGRVPSQEA
jgi:hypothetical protein